MKPTDQKGHKSSKANLGKKRKRSHSRGREAQGERERLERDRVERDSSPFGILNAIANAIIPSKESPPTGGGSPSAQPQNSTSLTTEALQKGNSPNQQTDLTSLGGQQQQQGQVHVVDRQLEKEQAKLERQERQDRLERQAKQRRQLAPVDMDFVRRLDDEYREDKEHKD